MVKEIVCGAAHENQKLIMLKLLCFRSGLSRRAAVSGVVPVVYSLVLANNLQNNHFSNFMYMND